MMNARKSQKSLYMQAAAASDSSRAIKWMNARVMVLMYLSVSLFMIFQLSSCSMSGQAPVSQEPSDASLEEGVSSEELEGADEGSSESENVAPSDVVVAVQSDESVIAIRDDLVEWLEEQGYQTRVVPNYSYERTYMMCKQGKFGDLLEKCRNYVGRGMVMDRGSGWDYEGDCLIILGSDLLRNIK